MKNLLIGACALFVTAYACAQDLIITCDAKKIDAKVLEISETEIKYKEADDLEGPTYVLGLPKVLSIIFSSGTVKVFGINPENTVLHTPQEPRQEMTAIDNASTYLSLALLSYLDGSPKNVVYINGDFSMLYNKDVIIFFQFNYENAEIVEYGHNDEEINQRLGRLKDFRNNHPSDFKGFEINHFEKIACDKFNTAVKKAKCTMMPSSEFSSTNNVKQYLMRFNVETMDIGSRAASILALNTGTKSGGVILSGKITIIDQSNQENVCTLYVDRVKGIGSPHFHARFVNTLEELFIKQLFLIKKIKQINQETSTGQEVR